MIADADAGAGDGPELNRERLSDKAYRLIRRSIVDGTFAPEAQLVESEIARRLGVSQAPVREAVKRLAHEGLATSVPRRGTFVTRIADAEFEAAREVRATIERLAAATIAAAEDIRVDELRRVAQRMRTAAAMGDLAELRMLDIQFHQSVVALSRNPFLVRMWAVMEPTLVSQRVVGDPSYPGRWEDVAEEHARLVQVLEESTPDEAGATFHDHAAGRGHFGHGPHNASGLGH